MNNVNTNILKHTKITRHGIITFVTVTAPIVITILTVSY
jgi:hypothetical protein